MKWKESEGILRERLVKALALKNYFKEGKEILQIRGLWLKSRLKLLQIRASHLITNWVKFITNRSRNYKLEPSYYNS